ncbi:MAG: translocation/assembly module TamB domain-containing protein [bacterium]
MKWIKKTGIIFKWTAICIIIVFLLAALLFGSIQTTLGKRVLGAWIESVLSKDPDFRVNMGELHGFIPFHIQLDSFGISDRDGMWLDVREIVFRWSPKALLQKKIHINTLRAQVLRLERLPESSKQKKTDKKKRSKWPISLPPLMMENFSIKQIILGESVFGKKTAFFIESRIQSLDHPEGLMGYLKLKELQGPPESISMDFALKGAPPYPILTLRAMVEEAEQGLISKALRLRSAGPVSINLDGEGPIDSWEGRLTAKAEHLGSMETLIGLTLMEKPRLTWQGRIFSNAQTMIGNEADFSMDISYQNKGEIFVHKASFDIPGANLKLTGLIDFPKETINADFLIGIEDITPFIEKINPDVEGEFFLQGKLSGPFQQPTADLSLQSPKARFSDLYIRNLISSFQLDLIGPLATDFPGLILKGNGQVDELTHPGLERFPVRQAHWSLAAQIRSGEIIDISMLEVSLKDANGKISGRFNPKDLSFKGNTDVHIRDFKILSGLAGKNLSGEGSIQASLEAYGRENTLLADMKGKVGGLSLIPPALSALLGPVIEYKGRMEIKEAKNITISHIEVDTAPAKLTGEASINILKKHLKGQCRVNMPSMTGFSELIKRPLEGGLKLDMDIEGPFADPGVRANAELNNLLFQGIQCQKIQMALDVASLTPKPKGDVRIDLKFPGMELSARSDFSADANQLELSNLFMMAPATEIRGDLNIPFNTLIPEGIIRGECRDLSFFATLLKTEIRGNAGCELHLFKGETGPEIGLFLQGREIETPLGNAEELQVNAGLRDLLKAFGGSSDIRIKGFHKDKIQIEDLSVSATGDMKQVSFVSHIKGTYGEAFALKARGNFSIDETGEKVQLELFQGQYADYPLYLTKTMFINLSKNGYGLEDADFNLAEGKIHISGLFNPESISGEVLFQDISLDILYLFGYSNLTGSASGQIKIKGAPDNPEAGLDLSVIDAKLNYEYIKDSKVFAPAQLSATGKIKKDSIQGTISIKGLAEKPIEASFHVPVLFSLSPFSFSIPSEGKIEGKASAEFNLDILPVLFNLEDQVFQGILNLAVSVEGEVKAPKISGNIYIANGTYENPNTGTILKDIRISIIGQEQKLVLEKAQATDGEKGRISAQGWLRIISAGDISSQMDLNLQDATLLRRYDRSVTTNGHLVFSSLNKKADLSGNIIVGPAELTIPERLPPEITDMEVIEINRVEGEDISVPKPKKSNFAENINLSLKIDIPGRVFVRGRGLDSEWKGALQVMGNAQNPSITGTLSIVRGNFIFFGKRFILTTGAINFDGMVPTMPRFEVTAENRRSDLTARLLFKGTPSEFSLNLESEPILPSDEILARVLFDRNINQITPIQALRIAGALNTLSGRSGLIDFMGRTRKFVGLDQLEIKQSEEGNGETSVSIGKYLADGVFVEMEKGIGTDSSSKVLVEIELTPNTTIDSETGSDSQGGIGLNWKWDY